MGGCKKRFACFLGVLLALRRMDPKERGLAGGSGKANKSHRHRWLVACDANMCQEDFEKKFWFQRELMHVVAPKEASTQRSKDPKEWLE